MIKKLETMGASGSWPN